MADDFAEYIYGTSIRKSEDERVWELTPNIDRRERVTRCRDCISSGPCASPDHLTCYKIKRLVTTDGFCAWGSPRDGSER